MRIFATRCSVFGVVARYGQKVGREEFRLRPFHHDFRFLDHSATEVANERSVGRNTEDKVPEFSRAEKPSGGVTCRVGSSELQKLSKPRNGQGILVIERRESEQNREAKVVRQFF